MEQLFQAASKVWAQLGTTSFSSLAPKGLAQVTLAPVTWLSRCPLLPEILRTEHLALPPLFRAMPRSGEEEGVKLLAPELGIKCRTGESFPAPEG